MIHQPLRDGMGDAEVIGVSFLRPGQVILATDQGAQHAVDQPGHLLHAAGAGQLHRLVGGGEIRNLVHQEDLAGGQAQDVADFTCQRLGVLEVLIQRKIDLHKVFHCFVNNDRGQALVLRL